MTMYFALEGFRCSVSKHWKLLKKFDQPGTQKHKQSYFKAHGNIIDQDQAISDQFATYLNTINGQPTPIEIDPDPPDSTDQNMPNEPDITLNEMMLALSSCNSNGAPGIDTITNKMLKLCPPNILSHLLQIFNASHKLGHLPNSWKFSKVIMIHKKNKPNDDFSSYRPISLISCISKWLEKIMNARLLNWAEANNILPPCQSGFRKKTKVAMTT